MEKEITTWFPYFFKIREAWIQLIAERKERLKKVRSNGAQLGKGGCTGQEGMESRTQGKD